MTTLEVSRAADKLEMQVQPERDRAAAQNAGAADTAALKSAAAALSPEALQTAARLKVILSSGGGMVVVSGIAPEDGLTALAETLAAALAATDESPVLLVDGDVQNAQLHQKHSVPSTPGLLDLLEQRCRVEAAPRQLKSPNLFLLPAGQAEVPLAALLSASSASEVFAELRRTFRYVVVAAGVIRNQPGATLLASLSDGVVAGVAAGLRRSHEIRQFQQELKQLKISLLGVVLTQLK